MPLDTNYLNYLPANEDRNYILDPSATGIDDSGNIRPLDFIADLSISCSPADEPYLSSVNIGKDLISGIIMTNGIPILTFTVLKRDWNYGKPIFLESAISGYSGWITPGRLNVIDLPIVYVYSTSAQSKLAERCLFRLHRSVESVVDYSTGVKLNGVIALEGLNGLSLDVLDNQLVFVLNDENKQSCANGVNYVAQYREPVTYSVGSIGGAFPDEDGNLSIIFEGPFTLTAIKNLEESIIGAVIETDIDVSDLCTNKQVIKPDIPNMSLDCKELVPYTPAYQPEEE